VEDVIKVIKNLQAELLRKVATQTDIESVRDQMKDVEKQYEKMLEKSLKDLELKEHVDNLASLPSKIKALQMDNLRNENLLTEEKRSSVNLMTRIN